MTPLAKQTGYRLRHTVTALLLSVVAAVNAEDRLELEGTSIIGSKEAPQVLYVVPWQKPEPGAPLGPPSMGWGDDLLAPVDRDVFTRQLDYYQALTTESQTDTPR